MNGITGGIPITVPSVNGQCLQGKPIRTSTTGLLGDKKRVTKCLVGTGSQVADYLSKAAGSLAGMAGEVLERPTGSKSVPRAESTQAGDTATSEQTASAAPVAEMAAAVKSGTQPAAEQPAAPAGTVAPAPGTIVTP